jgi:low temperature requirement protein LtrA
VVTTPSDEAPPGEGAAATGGEPGERHASWLELFFDLVVVAAVAQLADRWHALAEADREAAAD